MRVGIIGAMENEVAALVDALEDARSVQRGRLTFFVGRIRGVDVVVVRCGVGKVSMACCAQQLVDLFDADVLVNTGVAGAVDDALCVGDVVVATDVVHHDVDVTLFGYEPGQVPGYPLAFPADAALSEACAAAAAQAAPDVHVARGRVASGERFVSDPADRARVCQAFGALCAEMEGAALAQAAWLNERPFVVLRAMSDRADGTGTEDYQRFEDEAADRMARLLIAALPALAGEDGR